MKISVLIPAYKAAGTIVATVDSVLAQTLPPHEIIVLLDGVFDDTAIRLQRLGPRVTVVAQDNQGVACARNRLVELASGELLAFLDADDLWHPDYLRSQVAVFTQYPEAVAGFCGHLRFKGADHVWDTTPPQPHPPRLLDQVAFFTEYNITTAVFGSMSYCCVRQSTFDKLGAAPFSTDLRAAEDSFLAYQMALLGPVTFLPTKLVAYRLLENSLSQNHERNLGLWSTAFARLESKYMSQNLPALRHAFRKCHASQRRVYAKVLMGVGKVTEARHQLRTAMRNCQQPVALAKSLGILVASYLPKALQPTWPSAVRIQPGQARAP